MQVVRSGNEDGVHVLSAQHLLVRNRHSCLRDAILQPALEIGNLFVVDIGQRAHLDPGILHEAIGYDGAASPQTNHAQTDAIVGSQDRSIGASVHAPRCNCGGRSGVEEVAAIHREKASFIALYAGAITSAPFFERFSRSSSFSTHPFQPICLMAAATWASGKVPWPRDTRRPFL